MRTDDAGWEDVPGILRFDVNREEIELRCEVARKMPSEMTPAGDVIAPSGDATGGLYLHSPQMEPRRNDEVVWFTVAEGLGNMKAEASSLMHESDLAQFPGTNALNA